MTLDHFKEIMKEHKRKVEEDERNKQRVDDYYKKLATTQCSDDYAPRVKQEEK